MVSLGSPEIVEILAAVGFDWLFLDAEHAPLESLTIQRMLQVAGDDTACLVRLAASNEVSIKKALDMGADGIIAPMVNDASQAKQIVQLAKYPPQGRRGVGLGRAHGYGLSFQDYIQRANAETVVVVQAEHILAVENMEEIVKVAGVDAVLVGPYDLSASLGVLGEITHPKVTQAIDHISAVCLHHGMPLGFFGLSTEAIQQYIERGYTLIVAGVDSLFLGQAAANMLAALRRSP